MEIQKLTIEEIIELKEKIREELAKRGITPNTEFDIKNRKPCPNCGQMISRRANFCRGCAAKNRDNKKLHKNLGDTTGEKNGRWKGDKVGYFALHEWIKKNKPKPKLCEKCKKIPPRDLANISGEYKRDVNDFEWLCRSCHFKKDRQNLKRDKKGRFKSNAKNN